MRNKCVIKSYAHSVLLKAARVYSDITEASKQKSHLPKALVCNSSMFIYYYFFLAINYILKILV